MKNWIHDLDEQILSALFLKNSSKVTVSRKTDNIIIADINKFCEEKTDTVSFFQWLTEISFLKPAMIMATFVILFISTILLIPLLFPQSQLLTNNVILVSGSVIKLSNKKETPFTVDSYINNKDIIKTDSISSCIIQIAQLGHFVIDKQSAINFRKLSEKNGGIIEVDVQKGLFAAAVKLPAEASFNVITPDALFSITGTRFTIEVNDSGTRVTVFNGTVILNKIGTIDTNTEITTGTSLSINNGKILSDEIIKEDTQILKLLNLYDTRDINSLIPLTVTFNIENALVTIDNKQQIRASNQVAVLVEDGDHTITIEKEGYRKYTQTFNTSQQTAVTEEIVMEENSANQIDVSKTWQIVKKYTVTGESKVLAIETDGKKVAAVTETAVAMFDINGKVLWQKDFKDQNIYFMSQPLLHNNKLYISTATKKLLVLDCITGSEDTRYEMHNSVIFGFFMTYFQDNLYIPYADGVYTLSLQNGAVSKKPVLPVVSPGTPVLFNNLFLIASYSANTIECFNNSGLKLWEYSLNTRSFNKPVVIDNTIFINDKNGTIYKLSIDGKLIKKNTLPTGIESNLSVYNKSLFSFAKDGSLYRIDSTTLQFSKIYSIDTTDIKIKNYFLFKSPLVENHRLFLGNNNGTMILYNLKKNQLEVELQLDNVPLTTSVVNSGNYYCVGNEKGTIYFVVNK